MLMADPDIQRTLHIASIVGIFAGPVMAYIGYHRLGLKRLIESIPTSKIGALKAGLVEICGKAVATSSLCDPIWSRPCVYYSVRVEERERLLSQSKRQWRTVFESDSSEKFFFVEDETGRAQVLPSGAELFLKLTTDIDRQRVEGFAGLSLFDPKLHERRVTARILRPGDPVFVLGWASLSGAGSLSDADIARALKGDAERMRQLDIDGNGSIDGEEFDRGMAEARQRSQAAQPEAASSFVLSRGVDGPLIISDSTESGLVSSMALTGNALLAAGAALAAGGALYLIL